MTDTDENALSSDTTVNDSTDAASYKLTGIYGLTHEFINQLDNLLQSATLIVPALNEKYIFELTTKTAELKAFVQSMEGLSDNQSKTQFLHEHVYRLDRIAWNLHRVATSRPETAVNGLFVTIFSLFDVFMGELLRYAILHKPDIVSGKQMTLGEISSYGSIEAARDALIEKEVEIVLRESYTKQFDYLEGKLEIPLRTGLDIWPDFIELSQRRNLITHAAGKVSQQYIDQCNSAKYKWSGPVPPVGSTLKVNLGHIEQGIAVCYEVGFKLAQTLYRKLAPDEYAMADTMIIEQMYNLLATEQWSKAIMIGEFSVNLRRTVYSNDEARRIMIINLAQAYKWSGNTASALAIVKKEDWSSCGDHFGISVAMINDDYNTGVEIMQRIDKSGRVSKAAYIDWPIFRELRKQEVFMAAFEKIFGVSFTNSIIETIDFKAAEAQNMLEAQDTPEINTETKH